MGLLEELDLTSVSGDIYEIYVSDDLSFHSKTIQLLQYDKTLQIFELTMDYGKEYIPLSQIKRIQIRSKDFIDKNKTKVVGKRPF